ncbi:hypothetical protein KDK95_20750 [Actinospica sp. MGRD01-02]|uniref:Uncharacterized protein n=1 Tax=Actinospica acidithermotolerans TaxID=2828514 RepID=A0A941IHP1_9ACTN|nr:hypothetical protein [Actinospica acidithermotolerans]MBR7828750.1 hypothetical protein [Actinospica acidithermotolerans]
MPDPATVLAVRVLAAAPTCQSHESLSAFARLMFAPALVIAGFIVLGVTILWGIAILDRWDGVRNRRRSRAAPLPPGINGG